MPEKCEVYRALIEEAAGGAAVAPTLGAHLAACGACREFRREREALVGLLGRLGRVSAPDDFEFRLRSRIHARRGGPPAPFWNLRLTPGLAALVAAVCLLATATAYFKLRPATGEQSASRATAPAAQSSPAETRAETARITPPAVADVRKPAPAVAQPRRTQEAPRRAASLSYAAAERRSAERPRRAVNEGTFSVGGAAVISGPGRPGGRATAPAVALRTSPETLRVVLRDERGMPYMLPMRSVSFGSQTPVGRVANAAHTNKEGVW